MSLCSGRCDCGKITTEQNQPTCTKSRCMSQDAGDPNMWVIMLRPVCSVSAVLKKTRIRKVQCMCPCCFPKAFRIFMLSVAEVR